MEKISVGLICWMDAAKPDPAPIEKVEATSTVFRTRYPLGGVDAWLGHVEGFNQIFSRDLKYHGDRKRV